MHIHSIPHRLKETEWTFAHMSLDEHEGAFFDIHAESVTDIFCSPYTSVLPTNILLFVPHSGTQAMLIITYNNAKTTVIPNNSQALQMPQYELDTFRRGIK